MPLTPEQRKRVDRAVHKRDPKDLATPAEVHQFVHHYNWDDGPKALRAALANPACDRGTALMMFWLSEPTYAFDRYESLAEAEAARDVNVEDLRFLEELLEALQRDAFQHRTIRYDPPSVEGKKRSFPPSVLAPSPGVVQPEEPLVRLAIEELTSAERTSLERQTKSGVRALAKHGVRIAEGDPPERVVAELDRVATLAPTLTPALTAPSVRAVGLVFAEQLRRAWQMEWFARVAGTRTLFLFTSDGAICVEPARLAKEIVKPGAKPFSLVGIFDAFGRIARELGGDGARFAEILSRREAAHLFRGPPGTAAIWGIHWQLPPWPEHPRKTSDARSLDSEG